MSAKAVINLGSLSSVTIGTPVPVGDANCTGWVVWVTGTFVATWELGYSPDGTQFFTARSREDQSNIGGTAAIFDILGHDAWDLRPRITAYTSGTVNFWALRSAVSI